MSVYLITGASGYLGSMLAEYLLGTERDSEVIALARGSASGFGKRGHDPQKTARAEPLAGRVRAFQADLCDGQFVDRFCAEGEKVDYIFHCASVTRSSEMAAHPAEVIQSIVNTTQNVLELARRYEINSMVYLSSMEIYGDIDCSDGHRVREEEAAAGRVELLNVRSCYPLGKRMAENICYSYFKEYGVPVKIARLAQTFGRGISPSDNRVFAQFARSIKNGTDIVLHTEGRSMGNYCAVDDAVEGLCTILKKGQSGEAYNVVNEENTMTIRQMAHLAAAQAADGRIGVRVDIPQDHCYGYAADTGLRLSGEKLRSLGWRPGKTLTDMYRELLADMV